MTIEIKPLFVVENSIKDLLLSNKRKQQNNFNLLLVEMQTATTENTTGKYLAITRKYISNILKDNDITLNMPLRAKIKRLLDNSNLIKKTEITDIEYSYKKPTYSLIDDNTIIKDNSNIIDDNNVGIALSYRIDGIKHFSKQLVNYYFN